MTKWRIVKVDDECYVIQRKLLWFGWKTVDIEYNESASIKAYVRYSGLINPEIINATEIIKKTK